MAHVSFFEYLRFINLFFFCCGLIIYFPPILSHLVFLPGCVKEFLFFLSIIFLLECVLGSGVCFPPPSRCVVCLFRKQFQTFSFLESCLDSHFWALHFLGLCCGFPLQSLPLHVHWAFFAHHLCSSLLNSFPSSFSFLKFSSFSHFVS